MELVELLHLLRVFLDREVGDVVLDELGDELLLRLRAVLVCEHLGRVFLVDGICAEAGHIKLPGGRFLKRIIPFKQRRVHHNHGSQLSASLLDADLPDQCVQPFVRQRPCEGNAGPVLRIRGDNYSRRVSSECEAGHERRRDLRVRIVVWIRSYPVCVHQEHLCPGQVDNPVQYLVEQRCLCIAQL